MSQLQFRAVSSRFVEQPVLTGAALDAEIDRAIRYFAAAAEPEPSSGIVATESTASARPERRDAPTPPAPRVVDSRGRPVAPEHRGAPPTPDVWATKAAQPQVDGIHAPRVWDSPSPGASAADRAGQQEARPQPVNRYGAPVPPRPWDR
ncbi:MAG: hypothetical protein AB7J30_12610 [Hyphomicrobium sp.]|uniref:hypothetical protein n=1 Tax=Hyphomicrobium sp. TaxID=82 RepID=UPI003D14B5E3